jgi:ATP-dependent RNA/DNA helicase IGHMBP2
MEYFESLSELLKIEQQTDRKLYQDTIINTNVHQRRASGIAWYPIAIKDIEPAKGDYINVLVERTTNKDEPHQLRYGMPAVLFGNHDAGSNRLEGIISHCRGNTLKINLRVEELPDWCRDGKLGIDLLFDENSYKEMQQALDIANKNKEEHKEVLTKVLIGKKTPSADNIITTIATKGLNTYQQQAVLKIVNANELAIVHGPPGTGKTTTLIQAIIALLNNGAKKILVAAPSNTAVDVVSEKLHLNGVKVLRIGNPVRVSEALQTLTLDEKICNHATNVQIKKLRRQANDYRDMAQKYKRNFGIAEREKRKALFTEARKIMDDVEKMEAYIIKDILDNTQVVTATLVASNNYAIKHLSYDAVIIDEAGQALEPACWIPILKTQKLILAGDHCQLPPTIKSIEAAKAGLEKTLLEKCVEQYPQCVSLLQEQYRMHQQIMQYSSTVFYNNKLVANDSVKSHTVYPNDKPVEFIDTAGTGYAEAIEGTAISNMEEASLVLNHLSTYLATLQQIDINATPNIAVISPYKQQINMLKGLVENNTYLKNYAGSLMVNTIDSFQGQEKDIIYISLVRSNDEGNIGFLSDLRRTNVAMTRARKKLVIFGDSATLSRHKFYDELIQYVQSIDGWDSAWSFM